MHAYIYIYIYIYQLLYAMINVKVYHGFEPRMIYETEIYTYPPNQCVRHLTQNMYTVL